MLGLRWLPPATKRSALLTRRGEHACVHVGITSSFQFAGADWHHAAPEVSVTETPCSHAASVHECKARAIHCCLRP